MLGNIIDLLQIVNGETESIKVVQGKNYLPNNFKDSFRVAKKLAEWEKNKTE